MAREDRAETVRRVGAATGVSIMLGAILVAGVGAAAPRASTLPLELTLASPRPFFMQLGGQGPLMANNRVVWTAINAQGEPGSQADQIYAYDLVRRHLSVPVHSGYGAAGFIGGYALAANRLAYVDTGISPGGALAWRVSIVDLRTGRSELIAAASPTAGSRIPPQIAFDGVHMLMLQTIDRTPTQRQSVVTLYTLSRRRQQVLQRVDDVVLGDPVLAGNVALWTTISFGTRASSRLMAYQMTRHTLRRLPVGDVSQLSAGGDLVVWKTGLSGVNGHIGVYSVSRNRLLATNLSRNNRAIFPSTDGHVVVWTYDDGSRVQVYSLGSRRVIYNAPVAPHRFYGLTAVAEHAVSWAYTVVQPSKGGARGYVVVRQIR